MAASTDTLSDVLRGIHLVGAIFFDVDGCAPWASAAPAGKLIASKVLPGVQHLISYHVVTEGTCWATAEGLPAIELNVGDIIVFPHGDAHVMSSAPGLTAKPDLRHYDAPRDLILPMSVAVGPRTGNRVHIVCGFLGCDIRPFNPLIATLPRFIHIRDRAGATRGWLNQFVQVAAAESKDRRPGSQAVLSRMSELMFVEAVRRHLETLPSDRTGWLAGLRDPAVGRALAALHHQPQAAWTLAGLADTAGVSRSVLAERFATFVGQPPMQYLLQWRMQLGARALEEGRKVTNVAYEVGYESEAAFSRAFKKLTGISPGSWRSRGQLAESGAVMSRQHRAHPAAARRPRLSA
jgi:AraC-like DNA-binding protein